MICPASGLLLVVCATFSASPIVSAGFLQSRPFSWREDDVGESVNFAVVRPSTDGGLEEPSQSENGDYTQSLLGDTEASGGTNHESDLMAGETLQGPEPTLDETSEEESISLGSMFSALIDSASASSDELPLVDSELEAKEPKTDSLLEVSVEENSQAPHRAFIQALLQDADAFDSEVTGSEPKTDSLLEESAEKNGPGPHGSFIQALLQDVDAFDSEAAGSEPETDLLLEESAEENGPGPHGAFIKALLQDVDAFESQVVASENTIDASEESELREDLDVGPRAYIEALLADSEAFESQDAAGASPAGDDDTVALLQDVLSVEGPEHTTMSVLGFPGDM